MKFGQVILSTAALLSIGQAKADSPRKNVIILLVDDMGYGDMSCHGNPVFQTPNLDRLYHQSVRFTDFHAAPMSTPTRGQIMTGCEALRNGASWVGSSATHLRTDIPVLPEVMKKSGYQTAIFGKWHLGDNFPLRPQDRGFDYSLTYPQQEIGTVNDYWYNDYFDDVLIENGVRKQFKGFCTDVWFSQAIRWMDQLRNDEPFFLYLPLNVTHGPFFSPEEYQEKARELTSGKKHVNISYVATMLNLDENVGRFLDYMDDSGLSEDTILIFMTDNGATGGCGMYNAGMRGCKANLWEGGHRVPLFVRVPGNSPADINGLAQVEDIFPTILDLCHIETPEECDFDGISLKKQILKKKKLPDRILVNQFQRRMEVKKYDACIMWRNWRLLNGFDATPTDSKERKELYNKRKKEYQINLELYNLENDPHQDHNVIDDYPEIAARMAAYYDDWWQRIEPELGKRGVIAIGDDRENPLTLSAPGWTDVYFTQKKHILAGRKVSGTWETDVMETGNYRFRLYCWPEETNAPIRSAVTMVYTDPTPLGKFTEGVALDIRTAVLSVNGKQYTFEVHEDDCYIEFNLPLRKGEKAMIKADFLDASGDMLCGAYYVNVALNK